MKELISLKEMLDSLKAGEDEYHKMEENQVIEELMKRIDLELCKAFSDNIHRLMFRKMRLFFEDFTDDLKNLDIEPLEIKIPEIKKIQRRIENQIILKKFVIVKSSPLITLVDIYERLLIQLDDYAKKIPLGKERYRLQRSDIDASISNTLYWSLSYGHDIILCRSNNRHKELFENVLVKRYVQGNLKLSKILRRGKKTKDEKVGEYEDDGIISIESFMTSFRRFGK